MDVGLEKVLNYTTPDLYFRWQYFGSTTGMHRTYPGHEWPRNFIGFHVDYDPRLRPWYLSTVSGAKDVIIILDGSVSMKEGDRYEEEFILTNQYTQQHKKKIRGFSSVNLLSIYRTVL